MWHDLMGSGMWFGWIFWLLLIFLIVWFVVTQIKKGKQDSQSISQESPMDILKKRYAKGEITKKQFEQMKKDLS